MLVTAEGAADSARAILDSGGGIAPGASHEVPLRQCFIQSIEIRKSTIDLIVARFASAQSDFDLATADLDKAKVKRKSLRKPR